MHDREFHPQPGRLATLEPDLAMVLAPNPSPMTGPGTNTYLLGRDSLAVIDPGPLDKTHLNALIAAIDGRPVSHIIVTHSHLDHSPLARRLAEAVQAPVLAFGDTFSGRSEVMISLAASGLAGGGEGLDHSFKPDVCVADGDIIAGQGWALSVLHTPGHLGNHIALQWGDAIFVGDLVMGWSSSLVSPPDGDMTDFLESCARLQSVSSRVLYSGHGAPILQPQIRLAELIAHRDRRTEQILQDLQGGARQIPEIVDAIYVGLDAPLKAAAGRNVFAHLVDLYVKKRVFLKGDLGPDAIFSLVPTGRLHKKVEKSK
ncbi:MAG: glyoxylase-like metal-dependent hydrolase (beta-lactamase superfamily II) [bacterium]|jgi:glyoxylase-like metal-dependent hydrolase (beta-lactamase superfamily II)